MLSLLAGYVRFQGLDTITVQQTAGDLIADDEIRDQVAASAALVLALGVEVLRRQTAREVPVPPPPDLGGSVRRGLGRMRGGSPEQDRLEALERLGRLREQGVLTEEELAAEKAALVRG